MSTDKPRPGSMAEADQRSMIRFCIGATVIVVVVALVTYANLFNTYFFDYFKAGVARETKWFLKATHYLGALSFAASVYWIWKMPNYSFKEKSAWIYGVVALFLLALGILLAAGFNFDLHGIEK